MNSLQTQTAAPVKCLPGALTSQLEVTLSCDVADADDEDWAEFLALGARLSPADAIAGTGWRHAPVLLSY